MHTHRVALLAVTLLVLPVLSGCGEPLEPVRTVRVPLASFLLPESAQPTDTVRVSFTYENSCGEREVQLHFRSAALEVEVRREVPAPELLCPGWLHYTPHTVDIHPDQRTGDFTVIFRQPEDADSTRVIRRAEHEAPAP